MSTYYKAPVKRAIVAILMSSVALIIAQPAHADQSMEELEARLEKAKKRNLQLKAELIERENIMIEAEALEKDNARMEALKKTGKQVQSAQKPDPSENNKAIATHTVPHVPRHVAGRSIVERTNGAPDPKQTINNALAAIPANDPRRQFTAADMRAPVYKEPPVIVSYWDGAYAGVNVGYASGGSGGSQTSSIPLTDTFGSQTFFILNGNQVLNITTPPNLFASALATSGTASLNQSGLIGGLQGGWNIRLASSFVAGIETDIQGSTIEGAGSYTGYPVQQYFAYKQFDNNSPLSGLLGSIQQNTVGGGDINAGVHWLGTVRGRLGWLPWETLMVYGTGGLSYGNAYAEATNAFASTVLTKVDPYGPSTCCSYTLPGASASTVGRGRYNGMRVGWVAGGGIEWMFLPNWSVKAEGLYYDLGKAQFRSSALGVPFLNANIPVTQVRYDGAIGRLGLNYHFAQAVAPVSARY